MERAWRAENHLQLVDVANQWLTTLCEEDGVDRIMPVQYNQQSSGELDAQPEDVEWASG